MCNLFLDMNCIADKYNITVEKLNQITNFAEENLQEFINDNLISFNNNILNISKDAMIIVRNIAMLFDPMLKNNNNLYSKTI